jgi:chromate transporter
MPVLAVFGTFLKLGLTSFGGPIAHLGYFREEFVERKKWIEDRVYADLVALCQFTPGPASSKVGIGIGLAKAGLPGAFAAWFAFTLPSAVALLLFAYGVQAFAGDPNAGWLHGLKVAAHQNTRAWAGGPGKLIVCVWASRGAVGKARTAPLSYNRSFG